MKISKLIVTIISLMILIIFAFLYYILNNSYNGLLIKKDYAGIKSNSNINKTGVINIINKDYLNTIKSSKIYNCDNLKSGLRESCYYSFINNFYNNINDSSNSDFINCSKLPKDIINYCNDEANFNNSLKTNNKKLCYDISDKNKQLDCMTQFIGDDLLSLKSICDAKLGGEKKGCLIRYYTNYAIIYNNIEYCYKIINKDLYDTCVLEVKSNSPINNENKNKSEDKNNIIIDKTKDKTTNEIILDDIKIMNLAIEKGKNTYCMAIKDYKIKQECLLKVK